MNFSCRTSPLCVVQTATYNCSVQSIALTWTITDSNSNQKGSESLTQIDFNTTQMIAGTNFSVVVTNYTTNSVSSEITFSTLAEYNGYTLQCNFPGGNPKSCHLNVSGNESKDIQSHLFTILIYMLIIHVQYVTLHRCAFQTT